MFLPDDPEVSVLLIGGSGGNEPSYLTELLAENGVAAFSVAYFGRDGLPPGLDHIELGYFRSALSLMREKIALPIVVLGQSRGSEAAMLTAVHFPDLVKAVVVTVPGNVILSGYPAGGLAWLLEGAPLPYVGDFGPGCGNPDAVIPVELIPGPVMFVSAGDDEIWPSAPMARAMSARLDDHGVPHGHELLEYERASHSLGYLRPELAAGLLRDLADPASSRAARADAWPKVLQFIKHQARFGFFDGSQ